MEVTNPIRRLRETLGMSQEAFARELGMSTPSIRNYEAGQRVSHGALEKLKTLAAQKMLPDIAMELDDRPYSATRVYGAGDRVRLPRHPAGKDLADALHAALDDILGTGNADALAAVESVFQLARNVGGHSNIASKKTKSGAK